jgi:site-specific DNA-methyltransferase (adenine-specific)/adenine-specific DNA-methyltransferase
MMNIFSFLYERILIIRELMSDNSSIFVHCDYHKSHFIRCILEEVFSPSNFINEIIWRRKGGSALGSMKRLSAASDTVLWFSKTENYLINPIYSKAPDKYIEQQFNKVDDDGRKFMINVMRSPNLRPNLMYDYKGYKTPPNGWAIPLETMKKMDEEGRLFFPESKDKQIYKKIYLDEYKGQAINNLWSDISTLKGNNAEILPYPTQKPEEFLDRILTLASKTGDIILDCFMGSGTTQSVAMKLGRRFIGADINLGAVQITTKRLLGVAQELETQQQQRSLNVDEEEPTTYYTGFDVYNVNHYDVFRNPVQAKELLIEALELNPLEKTSLFDGEKDGRMWKIMPVNRIATKEDLNELISGFDYKAFQKRQQEHPNKPVESITLVCMGHDPDLKATLQGEVKPYKLDVEVLDILRDRSDLQFKRDSEAEIVIDGGELVIKAFYPLNLLGKLSIQQENVEDWKEMVESVMIDWNYDGAVLEPKTVDIPGKNDLVQGRYPIPDDAGTIRVKITDLLSESLEMEVPHG